MAHRRWQALLALAFVLAGCVPIPYPAVVSTRETPADLPAPLEPAQGVVLLGEPLTECVTERLGTLTPPVHVVPLASLPQAFQHLSAMKHPSRDDLVAALADPAVVAAVNDQHIVYAVMVDEAVHGDICDWNVPLLAAGGYLASAFRGHVFALPSSQDLGEVLVEAGGVATMLGISLCVNDRLRPAMGVIVVPMWREKLACGRMADELHSYFGRHRSP